MLVSPSGPTRPERVERGIALLRSWGLEVVTGLSAYSRLGYLAGTDAERLADLNRALAEPGVCAVMCTRGGYGVQRLIDGVDFDAVRADPRLLVGFSDITALQLALWQRTGLSSLHGPGAAWLDERTGPDSAAALRAAMMTAAPVVVAARDDEETSPVRLAAGGAVRGPLLGGNLCLLTASIGTPDLPDLTGAVLLLEEVAEPPYKVDRMLTQLHRSGALAGIAGVAIGQFTECADAWPTSIVDVLVERLAPLGVPVLGGLPIGHGKDQLAVPIGTTATLDVAAATLTVEAAVRA
jgi:muramoyltetrapeptide carboxypeptidase